MDQLINPQNLSLTHEQVSMLLPYFIVAGGAMLTLLVGAFYKTTTRWPALLFSLGTVVAALIAIGKVWGEPSILLFNSMMAADYYANLFNVILLGATGLVLLSSYSYLQREGIQHTEYYSLVLFACLGMMLLASALDLVVLFVALETMSIAVYVLVGFRRTDVKSNEAAIKYYILGSAASAIMVFGIALLYGATTTLNIGRLAQILQTNTQNGMIVLGAALLVIGFLFKVASVPFHMWMPDVYEGAPTCVTSFMTTGLKAAAFASFLRVFLSLTGTNVTSYLSTSFHDVLWVVALLTMFFGNVIALTQKNLKRMLAYSSIAHTGYLLVAFISGAHSEYGYSSVIVYLAAYVLMNIGAFAIVAMLARKGDAGTDVQDYAGLAQRSPWLAFAMAVFMFSMAGIPPTVGFAGKYLIFISAVQAGEVLLAILAVLCSAISAYYYLRVIVYMYMRDSQNQLRIAYSFNELLVIGATALATLQFGVFPSMLIRAARKAANF